MISCKIEQRSDLSVVCNKILGNNKSIDLVLIIDQYSNIKARASREEAVSSIRRMSMDDIAKAAVRINFAKGAFNVDKGIAGKLSNLHVRYNAMDIILYPLEHNELLVLAGVFEPGTIPSIYASLLHELPTKSKRAIVVDDELDIRTAIQDVLVKRGFDVTLCGSGDECITKLSEENSKGNDYGVVVLDIRMQGKNGFETFKEIQKISPNTKVLFITAFEYSESDISAMLDSSNVMLLKKPFSRSDLLQLINERIYTNA